MTDDRLAAELAAIRERNEDRIRVRAYTPYTVEHEVAEGDVRRLLAALGAVLKLAGKWDADAAELDRDIAMARKSGYASDLEQARTDGEVAKELRECAGTLRSEALAALTGKASAGG